MCATNADNLRDALDELVAVLQNLRGDLPLGEQLTSVFEAATRWRQQLKK